MFLLRLTRFLRCNRLISLRTSASIPRAARRTSADMARIVNIQNKDQKSVERVLHETAAVLRGGGVVAIPTDTIYGVASLVSNNEGVKRIYRMKGRQKSKPLAICVSEISDVYRWAKVTVPSSLLSQLLPGPVTTVFERQPELNSALNPDVPLVGVRIPEHGFVCQLVGLCGGEPLALTSANVSQASSTLSVQEFSELWPSLDLVVDAGTISQTLISHGEEGAREQCSSRLGSTVVDLSQTGTFTIIRPGMHYQQTLELLRDKYNLKEKVLT